MKNIKKTIKESAGGILFMIAGLEFSLLKAIPLVNYKDFDAAASYVMAGYSLSIIGVTATIFPMKKWLFLSVAAMGICSLIFLSVNSFECELKRILVMLFVMIMLSLFVYFRLIHKKTS